MALARVFHVVVDGTHDFAHRVFRCLILETLEASMLDTRQTECALTCMVCHRIGNDTDPELLSNLCDNRRLTNARSSYKENGTLTRRIDDIHACVITLQICFNRILDLLFRSCDVHHKRCSFRYQIKAGYQTGLFPLHRAIPSSPMEAPKAYAAHPCP